MKWKTEKTIVKTNEIKSWFLGKSNEIDEPLIRLTNGKEGERRHNK